MYRFDVEWFKNKKNKNLSEVEADGNLSEDQKNILRGIHIRRLSYADGPSEKDLNILQEIYGLSMHAFTQPSTCSFIEFIEPHYIV